MKLTPHTCSSAFGKRSVTIGIAISATQPSLVRRATTSQTPSQFRLMLAVMLPLPRKPPSPSSATCCSSLAPSGLVTNM